MKKGIVLLFLLSCLSTTSCSCSCHSHRDRSDIIITDKNNIKDNGNDNGNGSVITNKYQKKFFDELYSYALTPEEPVDYDMQVTPIDNIEGEYEFIPCLNSELCLTRVYGSNDYDHKLQNAITGETIGFLDTFRFMDYSGGNLISCHNIYYDPKVPVVVYGNKDTEGVHITFLDCFGNKVDEEVDTSYKKITWVENVRDGKNIYIKFRSNSNYYFKAELTNATESFVSKVYKINEDEYEIAYNSLANNIAFTYYDADGDVIAYLTYNFKLYDSSKNFIGELDFKNDYPYFSPRGDAQIGKMLYFFGPTNEEQTREGYIELNLTDGTQNYVENSNYQYYDSYVVSTNDSAYRYTYILFKKYKENKGNTSNLYFGLYSDKLNFLNLFEDDGFYAEAYKLNSKYVLAYYTDGWCLVSETAINKIDADNVIQIGNNQVVLYKDNLYYQVDFDTLIEFYGANYDSHIASSESIYDKRTAYNYISSITMNRLFSAVKELNGICYGGMLGFSGYDFIINPDLKHLAVNYGLFINGFYIMDSIGNENFIDYSRIGKITNVEAVYSKGKERNIFKVTLTTYENETVIKYFLYRTSRV